MENNQSLSNDNQNNSKKENKNVKLFLLIFGFALFFAGFCSYYLIADKQASGNKNLANLIPIWVAIYIPVIIALGRNKRNTIPDSIKNLLLFLLLLGVLSLGLLSIYLFNK